MASLVIRLCVVLVASGLLTLLFAFREYRASLRWGALWGIAFGPWLVAPALLNAHQLRPATAGQYAVVVAFFVISFALIGIPVSMLAAAPFAAYSVRRRPVVHNRTWVYALWILALFPAAYLAASLALELIVFAKASPIEEYVVALRSAVLFLAVPVGLLAAVYYWKVRAGADPRGRALACGALVIGAAGFAVLPARLTAASPAESTDSPLRRLGGAPSNPAPLFVLCLDGANWRTIQPLIDRGQAPTLARIVATGLHGPVEALWPPYWSNPAWAAILTGYTNDEVGVHEDLAATAPGLPTFEMPLAVDPVLNPIFAEEYLLSKIGVIRPMLAPRSALKRPPVWERLSKAGVRTAVIRLPFSYPAPGQAAYVFSNWLVPDLWDMANVQAGDKDKLVFPPSMTGEVIANFSDANALPPGALAPLLPRQDWPQPADSLVDPVEVLRRITTNTYREVEITKALVARDHTLSVVMLYTPGIDLMSHAFWQYRFPGDFPGSPPAAADAAELGPVLDRFVSRLDRQIGDIIASFPEPPNVLIVSDHGEGPTEAATLWKGWHASPGLFMAAGPAIPHSAAAVAVSYYDIAPTILDLEHFEKPAGLTGRSLVRDTVSR